MKPNLVRFHLVARCDLVAAIGFVLLAALGRNAAAQTAAEAGGEALAPSQPNVVPVGPVPKTPVMAYVAPATPPVREWYGYQLMLSDLGSLVTAAALSKSNGGTAGVVGVVGFVAVPAVIHGVHRNVTGAIVSPIVRLGLPVMGALIGAGLESCSPGEWFCGLGGAIVGGGIGMLTAMILDYSLAWQNLGSSAPSGQPAPPAARAQKPPLVSLTAAGIAPTTNGATLVLGGRF